MNLFKLFHMQKELDNYIETKRQLKDESLLERKLLAFQVELAELANETRSFKFWSDKDPSPREVILEEYVDGIHFLLSVGIEYGYDEELNIDFLNPMSATNSDIVDTFFQIMEDILLVRKDEKKINYEKLFQNYLMLGAKLGFSSEAIEKAYMQKNEVNHQRQDNGY
ncbi:dUTP diphosphatase [Salipaludibacillus daqingensis]|uniref:dUTP diphosphatase n=1 Tax=Salipaludibacillus daqingensis TaxID=3041001 RepID=UPI002476165A|nr:dUTP diphosphatase [Salipaludibacillus daqingensis]